MGFEGLAPSVALLIGGVLLDAFFGDPQFRFHPIRLMGRTLSVSEKLLRRAGFSGYGGGCLLFCILTVLWVALPSILLVGLYLTGSALSAL